jgi:hypothetical protein
VDRARQLYDAATVVDSSHACAWHKWGLLEKSEGNFARARDLWVTGIRRCARRPQSANAYLYNALAVGCNCPREPDCVISCNFVSAHF